MRFWKGWALWQKLSIALAFLLLLVLVYSFSVLTYNRRKIRKQATEEANECAEKEAQMGAVGSEASEIPFGARALEKGIEVEGIWTMKRQSLTKPPSIFDRKRTSVLGSLLRHKSTASSVQAPHVIEPELTNETESQHHSDTAESQAESVLESIHIDTFRSSRPPRLNIGGDSTREVRLSENGRSLSRGWFGSRSSWMKPIVGYKRMSMREGRRRGSSEEFRRRFSKLFDETLPPGPPQLFQLATISQEPTESSDGRRSLERIAELVSTR